MPIYAGETVRVYSRALNWNDAPMTPNDVASVGVSVSSNGTEITGEMTWLPEEQRWMFEWNTVEAGTYSVEVTVTGLDGDVSKEVRTVRLVAPRRSQEESPYFVRGD